MPDLTLSPAASGARPGVSPARPTRPARAARALAVLLVLAGALTLIDAGVTLVWQEPISALYATLRQDHLAGTLRHLESAPPTPAERRTLASLGDERRRIGYLAAELERHTGEGGAVGRIVIPAIGASFVLVNGTGTEALKSGPGVYPETGLPGIRPTTAIAGHRTTYLAPFRHIDSLHPGNRILLQMPYARFTYIVTGERVVSPSDVQAAVGNVGYTRVVLSACTPLFSAAKRLLVFAHLVRTVPIGAALTLPGGAIAHPIDARSHAAPARPALPPMLESLDPQRVAPLA